MYTISDIRMILQQLEQMLSEMEQSAVFREYEVRIRTGFTAGEMEALLEGEDVEEFQQKIAALDRSQQWRLVEELCTLLSKVKSDAPGQETAAHIASRMQNMLEVLSGTDENGALPEKAFRMINQDKELLRVLSEVRVESYLNLCMRYCNRMHPVPLVEL
ncbi:MAG: hypothetical protein IJ327_03035 [Lachnospiraceae bacterium]|nr:hypothetical protein [Lachnospiraceae bacterium]